MTDITMHNMHISYDEAHDRVRDFVTYLKSDMRKEEMKAYYEQALKQPDSKIHLNDKFGNEFTLICTNGHNCILRLRGM